MKSSYHMVELEKSGIECTKCGQDINYNRVKMAFDLNGKDYGDKRKLLRNCVHPDLGNHIFDCAFRSKQKPQSEEKNGKNND